MVNFPIEFSYAEYSSFIDKCKSLKSKYVCIREGNIYGIDFEPFYMLRYVPDDPIAIILSQNVPIYEVATLVESLKTLNKTDTINIVQTKIPFVDISIKGYIVPSIYNPDAFQILGNTLANLNSYLVAFPNPLLTINNIKEDANFIDIVNMKTADGSEMVILDGKYPISYFSKLINFTKADIVSLNIYHADPISFITIFSVIKKKFKINTICRYTYLK